MSCSGFHWDRNSHPSSAPFSQTLLQRLNSPDGLRGETATFNLTLASSRVYLLCQSQRARIAEGRRPGTRSPWGKREEVYHTIFWNICLHKGHCVRMVFIRRSDGPLTKQSLLETGPKNTNTSYWAHAEHTPSRCVFMCQHAPHKETFSLQE